MTDDDARRLISYTGERPISSVEWVDGGSLSDPVSSEGRDLTADENGSLDTSLTNGFKLSSVDAGNSIASAIAANNGVANTTAYIRVSFSPSSSDPSDTLPAYIIPVRLNVHGGVANDHKVVLEVPNDTTNLEAKASDITDEDAQDLIGNASSLTGATNFTAATGFKLVKDETGNAFEDSDLKYDNNNNNVDGGSYHNLTPVSGYVQISYGSSAIKQYVPVTIYVAAAASRYTPTISNDSNYNHITVHATSNGEVPVATQIADFVDPNNLRILLKLAELMIQVQ